jgi:hypothetical protein
MVSPVVQNLENVAISDPVYKQGQHDPVSETTHQPVQLPPPPPVAANQSLPRTQAASTSPTSATASAGGRSSTNPANATNYTPLAYNPAAPAAPEPIAHREDTPPPPDAADGTGLSAAAKHDHYAPQPHPQTYGSPPIAQPGYGQYAASPPPSFGPHAASSPIPSFGPQAAASIPASFGPHAAPSHTPLQTSPRTSVSTSFGPPPTNASSDSSRHPSVAAQTYVPHASGADPNSHIFGQPPVQTPGTQFYQSLGDQPHKALQHVQPHYPDYLAAGQPPPPPASHGEAPPFGGYSQYNYNQSQPGPTPGGAYDIHSQVYRPTEVEHKTHHHNKPSKSSNSDRKPSRIEKVEKGFGSFLKKVDKKLG